MQSRSPVCSLYTAHAPSANIPRFSCHLILHARSHSWQASSGQTGHGTGVRPRAHPQCFGYSEEGKTGSPWSFPLASPHSLRQRHSAWWAHSRLLALRVPVANGYPKVMKGQVNGLSHWMALGRYLKWGNRQQTSQWLCKGADSLS